MNVARFSIFFCCFWVDFLSAIWVFSLFFTLDSIFFSIAIYDLYVIHISRYLCCDIFIFIEFIFMFSCVCDSILLGFYAISFNYTFKVFRLILQIEAQKCEVVSFIYQFDRTLIHARYCHSNLFLWHDHYLELMILLWLKSFFFFLSFFRSILFRVGEFKNDSYTRRQHECKLGFVFRWYLLFSKCR